MSVRNWSQSENRSRFPSKSRKQQINGLVEVIPNEHEQSACGIEIPGEKRSTLICTRECDGSHADSNPASWRRAEACPVFECGCYAGKEIPVFDSISASDKSHGSDQCCLRETEGGLPLGKGSHQWKSVMVHDEGQVSSTQEPFAKVIYNRKLQKEGIRTRHASLEMRSFKPAECSFQENQVHFPIEPNYVEHQGELTGERYRIELADLIKSQISLLESSLRGEDQDLFNHQRFLVECKGRLKGMEAKTDGCTSKLEKQIIFILRRILQTRSMMVNFRQELQKSRKHILLVEASKDAKLEEFARELRQLKSQRKQMLAHFSQKDRENEQIQTDLDSIGYALDEMDNLSQKNRASDADSQAAFEDLYGQLKILEHEVKRMQEIQSKPSKSSKEACLNAGKSPKYISVVQKKLKAPSSALIRTGRRPINSGLVAKLMRRRHKIAAHCRMLKQVGSIYKEEILRLQMTAAAFSKASPPLDWCTTKFDNQPTWMYKKMQIIVEQAEEKAEELEMLLKQERNKNPPPQTNSKEQVHPASRFGTWKRILALPLGYAIVICSKSRLRQRRRKNILDLERKKMQQKAMHH